MAYDLPCKEPHCNETVHYERDTVFAGFPYRPQQTQTIIVYLTCTKGHTHRYTVTTHDNT